MGSVLLTANCLKGVQPALGTLQGAYSELIGTPEEGVYTESGHLKEAHAKKIWACFPVPRGVVVRG